MTSADNKWPSPDPQTTITESSNDVQISVKRLEADHQNPRSEPYVHRQDLYGIIIVIICINDIVLYMHNLPINRQSRPILALFIVQRQANNFV